MLELLADGERAAGELVAAMPALTQPGVSRHLRVLREAGLVEVHPDGQRRIYALREDGLIELDGWIRQLRRFWASRLDVLEHHLSTTPQPHYPIKESASGSTGSQRHDPHRR